jgi:hypothetical protein
LYANRDKVGTERRESTTKNNGPVSVSSDLKLAAVRRRMANAFYQGVGSSLIALAHRDIQSELAVPLDCNERVAVAKI